MKIPLGNGWYYMMVRTYVSEGKSLYFPYKISMGNRGVFGFFLYANDKIKLGMDHKDLPKNKLVDFLRKFER